MLPLKLPLVLFIPQGSPWPDVLSYQVGFPYLPLPSQASPGLFEVQLEELSSSNVALGRELDAAKGMGRPGLGICFKLEKKKKTMVLAIVK